MAVSLVKRYVSLVKATGRHAYNYGGYPSVVVEQFVPDAADVDDQSSDILFEERAREMGNHGA